MKENGVPEEHIILMAYNDIASGSDNPFPGQIFNSPTGGNVYDETTIDYEGDAVNLQNFIAVLTGDKQTAEGPVLESNSESKVFVFFSDHGAPGFVMLPTGEYLYADHLQQTIEIM